MRFLKAIAGTGLLLVGLVGSAVSFLALADPVGTKMADDADPFGVPPSASGSLILLVVFLAVGAVGVIFCRDFGGTNMSPNTHRYSQRRRTCSIRLAVHVFWPPWLSFSR